MRAAERPTLVAIDTQSSSPGKPYGIVTADCSEPKEIDDGLFVEQLDAEHETYRVGVCVVDTSSLYSDRDIFKQALQNTEAKYWPLPNGEKGYEPMIDPDAIKELEFTAGNVRSALIASFTVGKFQRPTDLDVSFGHVEVRENHNYHDFDARCQRRDSWRRYARAGAYIMKHLAYVSGGDYDQRVTMPPDRSDQYINMKRITSEKRWSRGAKLIEAYMVGTGHLIGAQVMQEDGLGIYRVHNPDDETFVELLPPTMAWYSQKPGPHEGLNIMPFSRVTSPLRRLEDFMMNHLLRLRADGKQPSDKDVKEVAMAVRELNRRVIAQAPYSLQLSRNELLGKTRAAIKRAKIVDNVIPIDTFSEDIA